MSLKGTKKVSAGEFNIDMEKVEATGGNCGERGTIQFTPNAKAKDTNSLRLVQVARLVEASKNADFQWTGGEAPRNQMRTTADLTHGVEGGFFVDHFAGSANQRSSASDPAVSPYYRDYAPNPFSSEDGHKKGETDIKAASLWDFPGWSQDSTFKFETVAKGEDTGVVYGTIKWQFSVKSSKVIDESFSVQDNSTTTFNAAVGRFNEYYKNPGASTAPK
jgi:hypothetical protein